MNYPVSCLWNCWSERFGNCWQNIRSCEEHDYPTDVLTFPLESPEENGQLVGDIVVSWDTARRNAEELGLSPEGELLLYVVHGTLHLLGFDDTDQEVAGQMRWAERNCLESLGFPYRFEEDEASSPSE